MGCSCCYSHIVCCVTDDTAAFRGFTCQCDIRQGLSISVSFLGCFAAPMNVGGTRKG